MGDIAERIAQAKAKVTDLKVNTIFTLILILIILIKMLIETT